MLHRLIHFMKAVVFVALAIGACRGWTMDQCQELFQEPMGLRIEELIQLRQEISQTRGPLNIALTAAFSERLSQLSPQQVAEFRRRLVAFSLNSETVKVRAPKAPEKHLQRAALQLFPEFNRRLELPGPFDFQGLKDSLLGPGRDALTGSDSRSRTGIQWSANGRFVAVRSSAQQDKTTVIDLENLKLLELPATGELTLTGNFFLEATAGASTRAHDLTSGRIVEFQGHPLHLPGGEAAQDHLLITYDDSSRDGSPYRFYNMKSPDPQLTIPSAVIFVDLNQRYIAVLEDGRLEFIDLIKGESIPHELSRHKVSEVKSFGDPFSGFIKFEQREGLLRRKKSKMIYMDTLKVLDLDDSQASWSPISKTKLQISSPKNSNQRAQLRSLQTGQTAELRGQLVGSGTKVKDEMWYVASEFDSTKTTELIRYNLKTGRFVVQDIPTDLRFVRFNHYLSNHVSNTAPPVPPESVRLFDPANSRLEVFEDGAPLFAVPEKDGLLVVQKDPNSQGLRASIRIGGRNTELEETTQFLSISPDGQWVLIEKNGKLELHQRPGL